MSAKPLMLAVTSLAACAPVEFVPPEPTELIEVLSMKSVPNRAVDLLFVSDDTITMADKQTAVRAAFPAFISALQSLDGGLPDLHLAVITPDMGTSDVAGVAAPRIGLVGQGGCDGAGKDGRFTEVASVQGAFLRDGEGARNYTGDLATAFGEMASRGVGGCGFEQPLHAMKRSLETAPAGFLRPGANLAVVMLTDEDDCSAADSHIFTANPDLGSLQSFRCFRFGVECAEGTGEVGVKTQCRPAQVAGFVDDVASYAEVIQAAAAGDARRTMFAAVAGDPTKVEVEDRMINGATDRALKHSCEYTNPEGQPSVADPAVRLAALVDGFPGRSTFESICSNDLAPQMASIGKQVQRLVGDTCLERLPSTPDCVLFETRDATPNDRVAFARCDGDETNCFDLVDDASCAVGLRLSFERSDVPADDAWLSLRCAGDL